MATKTIIIDQQNLLDIAVQETGTLETVFELAAYNGLSITEVVSPGTGLEIPETDTVTDVYNYYKANKIWPASGNDLTEIEILEGIDYWAVNVDFIVN